MRYLRVRVREGCSGGGKRAGASAHEGVGGLGRVLLLPNDENERAHEPHDGKEAVVVHNLLQRDVGDDAAGGVEVLLGLQARRAWEECLADAPHRAGKSRAGHLAEE